MGFCCYCLIIKEVKMLQIKAKIKMSATCPGSLVFINGFGIFIMYVRVYIRNIIACAKNIYLCTTITPTDNSCQ